MSRWLLLGMAVVLFGAAFVQPSAAQAPEPYVLLDVVPHGEGIVPITEVVKVAYTVSFVCDQGTVRGDQAPVMIKMSATTDASWAVVQLQPMEHQINAAAEDCLVGTQVDKEGNVSLSLAQDAPAGERFAVTLIATPTDGAPVSSSWNESVGAYLNTQAQFEKAIWKAPPQSPVAIPLVVTNLGNSDIVATPRLANGSGELNVTVPEPFIVSAGGSSTVSIEVMTPPANGYIDRRDQIDIAVLVQCPEDACDDTSLQEEHTVSAVVHTQGTDVVEGPGVGVFSLVLALLVGMSSRRR